MARRMSIPPWRSPQLAALVGLIFLCLIASVLRHYVYGITANDSGGSSSFVVLVLALCPSAFLQIKYRG